ncbi:MAG: choice-of-anchor D domain-containing protein, partial [Candidatus Acidiferrum sp.]
MPKNQLLGISALSFCMLSFLSQGGGCLHNPKPLPSVTISPNPVAFPATALGASSAPIPVTITNSGTAALVISSIVAGGSNPGDFTSTNTCSGPVASMGTCTITVTFIPTAPGQRSETITLTDNASDSPQVI